MKKSWLCAWLLVSLAVPASAVESNPQSKEVLATVERLLDAWREADVGKASAVLHPEFREVTLHENAGRWQFAAVSREQLLSALGGIHRGDWDDQLLTPTVMVDGPIATVWSRYRFRTPYTEHGVFHDAVHCGIETMQLYRIDGHWTIVNFADTHADCAK